MLPAAALTCAALCAAATTTASSNELELAVVAFDDLADARRLAGLGRHESVLELLEGFLAASPDNAQALALYADSLVEVGRADEGAHHYDRALRVLENEGESRSSFFRDVRKRLNSADPLAQRRQSCINKAVNDLTESCEVLMEHGHVERALPVLRGLSVVATGSDKRNVDSMLEEAESQFARVDLDAAGSGGGHATITHQAAHYTVEADLEPAVVELVGRTMDDIFASYVQIYLDGEESRLRGSKVRLRIHADWDEMTDEWPGENPTPGLGGWWSPSEQRVVCFDTRTSDGTLDVMLGTLFHEASHQFMTMLSTRGGWAPAWLNEGTASFFEGSVAMADGTVLWPDAAKRRLYNLNALLQTGALGLENVVGWNSPASYPGEMYSFGWGLVYYLQEYEDPETLEHVWRPYYSEYRERITTDTDRPNSMELFEEVFLARNNPGGHEEFSDFAAAWRDWIVNDVYPRHYSSNRRELRLERIDRYLEAAADAALDDTRAELRRRALRELQILRNNIDDPNDPDPTLVLREVEILRELGEDAREAAGIELVLDLWEAGALDLSDDEAEELEDRMYRIDRENEHPRRARARINNIKRRARGILEQYDELEEPLPLRTRTFCEEMGNVVGDTAVLLARATQLSGTAVERPAGMDGAPLEGGRWARLRGEDPDEFEANATRIALSCEDGPALRALVDQPQSGRFQYAAQLVRSGESGFRTGHGLVVAAEEFGDWIVVAIDGSGRLVVEQWYELDGELDMDRIERVVFDVPVEEEEQPWIAVLVDPSGSLEITVGEREPVQVELDDALPESVLLGAFVREGGVELLSPNVSPADE